MTYQHDDGRFPQDAIDLLVDNELDDCDRRDLLTRLDVEPDGWKRCALAFLESQAWRTAFSNRPLATSDLADLPAKKRDDVRPSRARSDRAARPLVWAARAATVMLAFSVGWLVRPASVMVVKQEPSAASEVEPETPREESSPAFAEATPEVSPSLPAPSYRRGRLEREGYQIERRVLIVPGSTPNGTPVTVPVEQVQVRFVGNRSV